MLNNSLKKKYLIMNGKLNNSIKDRANIDQIERKVTISIEESESQNSAEIARIEDLLDVELEKMILVKN